MMDVAEAPTDQMFEAGGVNFLIDRSHGKVRGKSTADHFVICKSDRHLDFYRSLKKYRFRDIFEIGMFEGGSLVLWDKWYEPRCLVGLDRRAEPIGPLEDYRADKPHIRTYYARSQDKEGTVMAARQNFPTGIDLVIDDASHLYDETRTTFENIFPLVRTGGMYIIEDWAWAHRANAQQPGHPWESRPALTNLLFELIVLAGGSAVIDSIHVDVGLIAVRRGSGRLPAGGLNIDGFLRGRTLPRI